MKTNTNQVSEKPVLVSEEEMAAVFGGTSASSLQEPEQTQFCSLFADVDV